MNVWPTLPLSEVTLKIGSGATPRGGEAVYLSRGTALIRSQNVLDLRMKTAPIARISDEAAEALRGVEVVEGDVLINITGDSIARCARVDTELLPARVNQHVAILRPSDALDPGFLTAYLVAPATKNHLLSMASGATRKALTKAQLGQIKVPVPPIKEQQAIAMVLGALDDKIAANTKVVLKLDAYFMARWRKLQSEVDELGGRSLAKLTNDWIGGDWGTELETATNTEAVYCVRGADMTKLQESSSLSMVTRYVKPKSLDRRRMRAGDIVVEMSGGSPTQSTGRSVLITNYLRERLEKPIISSNFCRVLRLKDPALSYAVYALLRSDWLSGTFFQYENGSTGIKNLAYAEYADKRHIPSLSAETISSFNKVAEAIFGSANALAAESERLTEIRDALLPQLMSGKLRVRDADKLVSEVVLMSQEGVS